MRRTKIFCILFLTVAVFACWSCGKKQQQTQKDERFTTKQEKLNENAPEYLPEFVSISGLRINDTTNKTNVTVYQQSNGAYTKIYAQPTVVIGGEEYVFPNPSGLSVRSVSQSVKCVYNNTPKDMASVYEGSALTFTFDAVPEGAKVNWTCSKEGLMDFSEKHGRTVTVETMKGIVNEPSENVCVTATATVDGHEYKGMYRQLYVFVRTIKMEKEVSTLEELQEAITDSATKNIAVKGTIALPEGTNLDLSGKNIYRDKKNTQAVFAISAPNVTMSGGTIDGQYIGAKAPLIVVNEDGKLSLENITLKNAKNLTGEGGAVSVENAALICDNVTFEKNSVSGDDKNKQVDNTFCGGGCANAILNTAGDVMKPNCQQILHEVYDELPKLFGKYTNSELI